MQGARGPTAAYTDPVTATQTERPEGPPRATWLDEGEVNPQWAPPGGDPVRRSPVPGSLVYGGVVLALVLTIAPVSAFGGFDRRTDLLRPVQPGTLISTGPFELSFTEATAQRLTDSKETVIWKIVVIGQARTTSDETIAAKHFGSASMFAIRDLATNTTAEPKSATIGEPDELGLSSRSSLAPGLPPMEYRLTFELPASYQPGTVLRLAVMDLEYAARYLTSEEEGWFNEIGGSRLDLPVRVRPPND